MSHLDVPRLHFGGLFFTNPATANNFLASRDPSTPLTNAQGQYISDRQGAPPAGWNALGVAQLWLEEAQVLSAVDGPGRLVTAGDPLIGAPVETPSPQTPKKTPDGKGLYDLAKLVGLDILQQFRSAIYGLRIYVTLGNGAGCPVW